MIMAENEEAKKEEKQEERKPEAKRPGAARLLKGKNWFTITAPALFNQKVLGEALAADPATIPGRIVSASLLELTGDPSRYYMRLFFKVKSFDGAAARTDYIGHETTRDFLARTVQLRTTRIDTNEVFQFKDGRMRVKTVAITNRHVTEDVEKTIRSRIGKLLAAATGESSMDQFIESFMKGELQQSIHASINKLYPLRIFEIVKTRVLV